MLIRLTIDGGCTFHHNSFRTQHVQLHIKSYLVRGGGGIRPCNRNIACPRFEVYETFPCVFMSNFMVFIRQELWVNVLLGTVDLETMLMQNVWGGKQGVLWECRKVANRENGHISIQWKNFKE